MSIVMLSLLGLMGLAFAFNTDDAADEEEVVVDEDEVVRLDADTLIGTQGDDVITNDAIVELEGYDDVQFGIAELNLLGGNDSVAEYALGVGEAIVNAGDGNDTIEFTDEQFPYVNGGDGDDVLNAYVGVLNGDAGNDTITSDIFSGLPNSGAYLSGGAGDDVLHVKHVLGFDNTFDNEFAHVTGGEGNDDFIVELFDDVEPHMNAMGDLETLSYDAAQLEILDFVPGEDTLTIDVSAFTEAGRYELVDVELRGYAPSDDMPEGVRHSVKVSLLEQGQTEPFVTAVGFLSVGGEVTMDDIIILTGLAA